ncbi:unnamed protein product, partial [marine sediment metagenome]
LLSIPPHEFGLQRSGSIGSEEALLAVKNFWESTLIPYQRLIEDGFNLGFEDTLGKRNKFKFDNSDIKVLQEDEKKKAELAEKKLLTHTINEVRQDVWKDEPTKGGDKPPNSVAGSGFQGPSLSPRKPSDSPDSGAGGPGGIEEEVAREAVTTPQQSLNGAQVTSLLEVVQNVAAGQMPREAGINILRVAFAISEQNAESVMASVGAGFKPETSPEDDQQQRLEIKAKLHGFLSKNQDWWTKRKGMEEGGSETSQMELKKQVLDIFA